LVDQPECLRVVGVRAEVLGVAGRRPEVIECLLLALLEDVFARGRERAPGR
jgi:hypothetical protein